MPSYAAIAPIARHRGREPQLACDLDQRPTAARQQGDRFHLELIRKVTPFLAHSTPSRSRRSLAKVSTNSGKLRETAAIAAAARLRIWKRTTSLGGVESLVEHRASSEGANSPVPPDLLRLSVGIEDP